MTWLVLKAQFIAQRYGGEEWPPAPMRLLQAIVAGLRWVDYPALRWLESLDAPQIIAETDPPVTVTLTWVPNNTQKGTPATPNERTGRDRRFRHIELPVSYYWKIDPTQVGEAQSVIKHADAVHTLGTGHDMCRVTGSIEETPPQRDGALTAWKALPDLPILIDEARALRVPIRGSLESMEARFQAGQRRYQGDSFVSPVLPPALHQTCLYAPASASPRHVMLPLELTACRPDDRQPSWHCGDAVIVAGMLRHACMQIAAGSELADWASGHAPETDAGARMSWVPLPSIGHRHADRRIRRAALMARPVDAAKLSALYPAILGGQASLVDQSTGEICAIARVLEKEDAVLNCYRKKGQIFQTITPIALPGDFADNDRRIRKLLRKAIIEAGIDPGLIHSLMPSRIPLHPRDVSLGAVKLKAWQAKNIPLCYARIVFSAPIAGPLILGRGCHYGLGLCANLE